MSVVEFSELTYRGRGAIAVVGVRGENARDAICKCFSPAAEKQFSVMKNRAVVYGIWLSSGEDLIVVRTDDERAGEQFEVHCHGGFAAVESIKKDLLAVGCEESVDDASWRLAEDLFQSEIAFALENALTQRTARHLLQQYELWQGFSSVSQTEAEKALQFSEFGRHLTKSWSVVLCGQPNVGKSSLINALAGFERAIVHETAGTTRDVVSQHTAIEGWPVELLDTAGIREASGEIESAGIAKAKKLIESADLVVHVVDASRSETIDLTLSAGQAGLVVVNKMDEVQDAEAFQKDSRWSYALPCPAVFVSAKQGTGIDRLQAEIAMALVPEVPATGQLVPVTETQRQLLDAAAGNQRGDSDEPQNDGT
jgi:tRNA modification GTPase